MAPTSYALVRRVAGAGAGTGDGNWRANATSDDFILEAWSEGFMVGALIIMACITVANMRRKVLLHKLILLELLLAMSHGTFCFMSFKGYGWYLSSTAALLYCSWFIHNVVSWLKVKPFFLDSKGSMFPPAVGKWTRNIYMGSLVCTLAPIILQIYNNFRFFNNISDDYTNVRPYEPLFRDPWWMFTSLVLFHVVQKCYGTGTLELVRRSPRFGILLAAIILALIFTIFDIVSSIHNFIGSTDGINPFWKLSLVFKCLTDTIMLDDFKTELKRLGIKRIKQEETHRQSIALVLEDKDTDENGELEFSDALNVSPESLAEQRRRKDTNGSSPRGRLRNDSVLNGRQSTGSGGKKTSHIPGLGITKGWSMLHKHKKEQFPVADLEKDAPDVVRSDSRQDPRPESSPSRDIAAMDDDETLGSGRNASGKARRMSSPSPRRAIGEEPGEQKGPEEMDDVDFQTKPAGL